MLAPSSPRDKEVGATPAVVDLLTRKLFGPGGGTTIDGAVITVDAVPFKVTVGAGSPPFRLAHPLDGIKSVGSFDPVLI